MSAQPTERLHALDAVRGFALLLGVAFHASMSFIPGHPIWIITDVDRSPVMGVTFFVLHMFRMTTFFVIAGFFARLSLHKRGQRGFIKERLKRIGIPLVAGWLVLFPAIIAVGIWAMYSATGKMPEPPPHTGGHLTFPFAHLWFLYVLLCWYAATLLLRPVVLAVDKSGKLRALADRLTRGVGASVVAPLVLSIPFVLASYLAPAWLRWFGIPTPDMSLIINSQAVAAFGTAFGFGWLLHRNAELLTVWRNRWALNLMLAVAMTVACLCIAGVNPEVIPAPHDTSLLIYTACYAVATWSWTLAFIGAALRFLSDFSAVRRYIADASYWVYLVHLPIVMALQVVFAKLEWPWFVKYPLILAIAFPVMFASYEWLVRYSFIGAVLNGRRYRHKNTPLAPATLETT